MSTSAFCDLVWLELWDDCGPMGDQAKYREAIQSIFYDGVDPDTTEVTDNEGNVRRVPKSRSTQPIGGPIPKTAMQALEDIKAQIQAAQPQSE